MINRIKRFCYGVLALIIPLGQTRHKLRLAFNELGIKKTLALARKLKNYKEKDFTYDLVIGAIVKNETPYIREWIEYYLLQGVKKFFIYNNDSEDDLYNCLKPYIDKGIVNYKEKHGKNMQIVVYNEILQEVRGKAKWLGFVDIDEFIVPLKHKNIPDFLKEYEDYDQVCLH